MRPTKRFHGLKKIKIRQTWNKYNLYNLSRYRSPVRPMQTYFQQKWAAKSAARAYHGETVREGAWTRRFRSGLRGVVPMSPRELAADAGARESGGRGAGVEVSPEAMAAEALGRGRGGGGRGAGFDALGGRKRVRRTPWMNMAFAPLERRLDVAIFRAMFASSTRQARQFCVHGNVKVNGKKMVYPGYMLNPGDMFQVDPERVMYATGAPKVGAPKKKDAEGEEEAAGEEAAASADAAAEEPEPLDQEQSQVLLKDLMRQAKAVLAADTSASAKRKQELRAFQRAVRKASSKSGKAASADDELAALASRLNISVSDPSSSSSSSPTDTAQSEPAAPAEAEADSTEAPSKPALPRTLTITNAEQKLLQQALAALHAESAADAAQPWATPWRPRDWMSAFACVPRFLEVHHRVCSAVYVRHPVARPGLAEVPSPFGAEVSGLAFNWYLRRR